MFMIPKDFPKTRTLRPIQGIVLGIAIGSLFWLGLFMLLLA